MPDYAHVNSGAFHVLLAEDNPGDVDLTREGLAENKVNVELHVATDGVQAMRFLRREGEFADAPRPDLVLLDLNMPRKDGREVLEEIRGDPDLTDLPVVILTSSEAERDVVVSYRLHANCYVVKPVDFMTFSVIIRAIESFWFGIVKLPPRPEP